MKLPRSKKISYPPVKDGEKEKTKIYEIEFRNRRHIGQPVPYWCTYKEDAQFVGHNFEKMVVRSDNLSELQHTLELFHKYYSQGMVDHRIVEIIDEAIFNPS
jgi:hypothetical protein